MGGVGWKKSYLLVIRRQRADKASRIDRVSVWVRGTLQKDKHNVEKIPQLRGQSPDKQRKVTRALREC